MNFLAINNFNRPLYLQCQDSKSQKEKRFGVSLPKPLAKDSVNFKASGSYNKVSDIVEHSVSGKMERLTRIATTYLDILESIAIKLKNFGVKFDRAYCEQNPVKSPKSYTSKIMRSGKFQVPDLIRATLYVDNPYDLSILNNQIIPELEKRGYVVAQDYMSMKDLISRGYSPTAKELDAGGKLMPDLDIRLADVEDQVLNLDPKYRYSIGRPQKSGYEDIQMRLIRKFEERKNPLKHELLILFGPNYAAAKHVESEKVYNYTRILDELRIKNNEDELNISYAKIALRYVDLIKKMMNGKISQKYYENAKNKDLYGITDEIPISFSRDDIQMFDNYFAELYSKLGNYYRELKMANKNNPDKVKQIISDARHDKNIVSRAYVSLKESIQYFVSLSEKEKKI